MKYYFDLILLASVWFVRSGQSKVVALYPVVSYFTPTFKGWHPSSSLARTTNRCVHANKEDSLAARIGFFLLFFSLPSCCTGCGNRWVNSDSQPFFFQFFAVFSWFYTTLHSKFCSSNHHEESKQRHAFRSMFIFSYQHHDVTKWPLTGCSLVLNFLWPAEITTLQDLAWSKKSTR